MENPQDSQIDLRQSPAYGKYIECLGWQVEKIVDARCQILVFIRKLGIFGSIAKIQRADCLPWDKIQPLLRKHHVWMTKLEPLRSNIYSLQSINFRQDSWPMLATKTLRIDLTASLEKIFNQFKKDARYCIQKAQKNQLSKKVNDFEKFYEIWKLSARRKNLWIPPKKEYDSLIKCFAQECFCITINDLAGALVLIYDNVAYYYYSGATPEGKKLNLPYLIIWECLIEAKKRNCKTWDFEGIYDSRWPNKGWLGFSHFKKSFGGYEVEFPGSFTKWF